LVLRDHRLERVAREAGEGQEASRVGEAGGTRERWSGSRGRDRGRGLLERLDFLYPIYRKGPFRRLSRRLFFLAFLCCRICFG
jgi:hypothetical protein